MTRQIGIYLFDQVEVLDFAGPYEVLTCASRVAARSNPAHLPFVVRTVARTLAPVQARAGLRVLPDDDWDSVAALDVLIVPGGVVDAQLTQAPVCAWLARTAARTELTASVCTGAFLLAQAGLLDGLSVTTHWEDQAALAAAYPQLRLAGEQRWIDHGRILTSAGISAGIDMSLYLVARLAGMALAQATARQMEYDWNPAP